MTIGSLVRTARAARPALGVALVGVLIGLLLWLSPAAAAQSEAAPSEAGAPGAEAPTDFRGKVTLAYGLVFFFVVIYLLISHRRNAAVREEIAFLERRLDELEARR